MIIRSVLFAPGDSERKLMKAAKTNADVVVIDLEDSVAPSRKEEARTLIRSILSMDEFGASLRYIRLNQIGTQEIDLDLSETLSGRPNGYMLPKAESAAEIEWLHAKLAAYESAHGLKDQPIGIIPIIETAKGVLKLADIAAASDRIRGLALGGEDLAASLGAKRTAGRMELFYARSKLVTVAAAFDLPALDTVFTAHRDPDGLARDAQAGADLGFTGKLAIHPNQLEVIHRIFAPSEEMIAWAREIKHEYERLKQSGIGVFTYRGQMIDEAHLKQAERILRVIENR